MGYIGFLPPDEVLVKGEQWWGEIDRLAPGHKATIYI